MGVARRLGIFAICAFVAAIGCSASPLARYERSVIYQPASAVSGDWTQAGNRGFEDANFQASDGTRLHGWFLDHPERRGVVLFMHGNGGNVALWADTLRQLVERHHVAALVFDYRGYGKSEGTPTEDGLSEDASAARRWLARRTGVSETSIVLMGQSLGGAVAVDLASRDGAACLVLLSTFTSAPDVAAHHLPWLPAGLLMTQRFNSLEKIERYDGPLLVCHGDADRVIPFEQGEAIFAASPSQMKRFVRHKGGDHNDPPPEDLHRILELFWRPPLPIANATDTSRMDHLHPAIKPPLY